MDLDRTSEARRKAQRNGEEDPVVVAQRFLNIYRQIHIFSAEKKEAFNKMLLQLPPQIRGMFGQLPGGAMLQDYVDELAEKEGVEKSTAAQATDIADEDVKQAKILATALAEAQVQASAKMQGLGVAQPTSAPAAATTSTTVSGTTKLSMDKNFAQEFAAVLASAMQKNSASQETEIKNIINTLGQTQLEIIKVLQEENAEHREEMKNISQMMLQAQTRISDAANTTVQQPPKVSEETKQLIKILINSQQKLLERIAKIETWAANASSNAANSNNISGTATAVGESISLAIEKSEQNVGKMIAAFQERQKNDTLEIAKLINESQQNLVQLMIKHNNLNNSVSSAANNNANNIQINTADYSSVLNRIADQLSNLQTLASSGGAQQNQKTKRLQPMETNIQINFPEDVLEKLVESQSKTYHKIAAQQTKDLSAAISLALKESQRASTKNIIEALKSNPIVLNQQMDPSVYIPKPIPQNNYDFTSVENDQTQAKPVDLFDDVDDSASESEQPSSRGFDFGNDHILEKASSDTEKLSATEGNAEPDVSFASGASSEHPLMSGDDTADEKEEVPILSEVPKKKKKKKKKKKVTVLTDDMYSLTSDDVDTAQLPEEGLEMPVLSEATGATEVENSEDEAQLEPETLSEPISEPAAELESGILATNDSDKFEPSTAEDENIANEQASLSSDENLENNSWLDGFDSSSEDISATEVENTEPEQLDTADDWGFTPAPEVKAESQGEGQDWEWVYEEEPATQAEDNGGEGVDWEWEYVPEDSSEGATFHNNDLRPLAENCPIYSGNLFFQEQVSAPQPIVNAQPLPILKYHPGILDSASVDGLKDPYKNSSLKD